jgi:hypothetical protein
LPGARPRRAPCPDLADQPTAIKPGPKWKRRADRPARHAVLKSATTKINYKKRETAILYDAIGEGSPVSGVVPASIVSNRSKTDTDRSV